MCEWCVGMPNNLPLAREDALSLVILCSSSIADCQHVHCIAPLLRHVPCGQALPGCSPAKVSQHREPTLAQVTGHMIFTLPPWGAVWYLVCLLPV